MWLAVCFVYIPVDMSKETTSKETVETKSYGKNLFFPVVKFPEFLGRPTYCTIQELLKIQFMQRRANKNCPNKYVC
jgi:hypothetical protein